jgi:hypothetical protein
MAVINVYLHAASGLQAGSFSPFLLSFMVLLTG